jgi:L-histidine N-alpha-methyltransferase
MLDETKTRSIQHEAFHADVWAGLSNRQKSVPCRWLYDDRGSELFEAITRLPEYYPTRTETAILRANAGEIADFAGAHAALLEYGAGAGIKTELLLRALQQPNFYVPIDIAGDFLEQTVSRMRGRFPSLRFRPVTSDFTTEFDIPGDVANERRVGFFPGSTIGNLDSAEASSFLLRMRRHVGARGAAIVGVDLRKDLETLLAAYDDAQGITAEFNLNLLVRINRELDGNFAIDRFAHSARWNATEGAIEMHIVSVAAQTVTIAGRNFAFRAGETIHTESSRKYDVASFTVLARAAGWNVSRIWTDQDRRFAVLGLAAASRDIARRESDSRVRTPRSPAVRIENRRTS